MKTRKNSKRGFFFTVMALAILAFMLLTVQVWVRTFEQQDRRAAEGFKGEALRLVLATMSDKALSDFANASAYYATYRLADYTVLPDHALLSTTAQTADPRNNYTGNIEPVIYELMKNGTSAPNSTSQLNITYGAEKDAYTYEAWQQKIQQAAAMMGMNATFSGMENFSYRQIDAWTIGVYFEVGMNISDAEGTMHQSKRLKANTSFSIAGFEDPSIARNELARRGWTDPNTSSQMIGNVSHKQVFRNLAYNSSSDVQPQLLYNGMSSLSGGSPPYAEGDGWFYGPVVTEYPLNMSQEQQDYFFGPNATMSINLTVLVHPWDANLSANAMYYGAVIVTTLPGSTAPAPWTDPDTGCYYYNATLQTECLNCLVLSAYTNQVGCSNLTNVLYSNNITTPFIAVDNQNFSLSSVPYVSYASFDNFRFVLLDNQQDVPPLNSQPWEYGVKAQGGDYHRAWDVHKIRDMAMCGFYVQGYGPSFLQRMLNGSQNIENPALGIETFLTGRWAGGSDDQLEYKHSRLDWEFYRSTVSPTTMIDAIRIKGMSGCKDKIMCSVNTNVTQNATGRLKLSLIDVGMVPNAIGRYGLTGIMCPDSLPPSGTTGIGAPCGLPEN